MFSTLRTRFGIPGVISVMALVFAMLGGAYAANNTSSGGKAAASAKAKKGPRGPRGPAGPAGPAGPVGPQGAAGAKGDIGATGANGSDGTDGTDGNDGAEGASVVASAEPSGSANCEGRGGSKFVTGSTTTYVCNGKNGTSGGGGGGGGLPATLGSGETETGAWSIEGDGTSLNISPISFPIPLSASDATAIAVHYWISGESEPEQCAGTPKEPKATPGNLCLYVAESELPSNPEVYSPDFVTPGVGPSGAILYVEAPLQTTQYRVGSFAITAPS